MEGRLPAIAKGRGGLKPIERHAFNALNFCTHDAHGIEFVLGHPNIADDDLVITIGNRAAAPKDVGLANVPIEDEVGAAAYHIPEGMLLAYDPRSDWNDSDSSDQIPTTRIAPTLLELSGVRPPAYMERPIAAFVRTELEIA